MSLDASPELNAPATAGCACPLLVLAIVSLFPLAWTARSAWLRLTQPNPQSPWESAILVDAWRTHHGMRVYTLPADDHATHMYGPLITYAVAPFMRSVNFSLRVPRYIAMVSSGTLAIVLGCSLVRRGHSRTLLMRFIAIVLVLTQFYRTRATMAESRPDAAAAAFAALAMWLFYLAQTRSRGEFYLMAGIVAMLVGFFFKQTAAAVAVVPVVAALFDRRRAISPATVLPPVVMVLAILSLRMFLPAVYYYVVTVPTLFQFQFGAWPLDIINLITTNVLFDIALLAWLMGICASSVSRGATMWILASVAVAAISCGAAVAKLGGQSNSYLMAFVAMAAFTIIMLPDMLVKISTRVGSCGVRIALTAFIAMALLADATGVAGYVHWATFTRVDGNAHYRQVVNRVKHLPGKLICPDDPTIPLKAKGYVGRNLVVELDAIGWQGRPSYLHAELKRADYVIRVQGDWTPQVTIKELARLGYKPVNDPTFAKSAYSLYHRAKPGR